MVALLTQFMNTDLSAFYFDIRKDALYCEPISSIKRKAALETIEQIFRCTCVWLAPLMCFTAEEAWLARYPSETASVHVETFPKLPASWRDDALAEEWEQIKRVRRVVTGALEIERANKKIGSSLEAAPQVFIDDDELEAVLEDIDFAEVCITSGIEIVSGEAPDGAFKLPDVANVGVVPKRGAGQEVRALLAHHDRCRQRSGLPRAVGARCGGRARVRCPEGRAAVTGTRQPGGGAPSLAPSQMPSCRHVASRGAKLIVARRVGVSCPVCIAVTPTRNAIALSSPVACDDSLGERRAKSWHSSSPLKGREETERARPMTTPRTSWLYGPLSQLGYTLMVLTLAFDQAHKWWMLLIYRIQDKGRIDGDAVPGSGVRQEHRRQLRHVPAG